MVPQFAEAIRGPLEGNYTCFLSGPLVAGQRQALIDRLRFVLESGISGYSIILLLPDRATAQRFREELARLDLGPYGEVELQTYYGLAVRLIRLFWPLVAAEAGFATPQKAPVFLNYESAQYALGQLVDPLFAQGYFEGLALRPQRAISQLLDNLNKMAVNGFALHEVGERLGEAWAGDESRLRYYEQAQHCVDLFRGHCLQHGLLDASLVFEVFNRHLVEKEEFWRYFTERYRHLLVDSVEEMVPVAHDLIARLLPQCDSACIGGDEGAGFRLFLGADAQGAVDLSARCKHHVSASEEECANADMAVWAGRLGEELGQGSSRARDGRVKRAIVDLIRTPYRAQMIEAVAQRITGLVEGGVAPGDIAVVAPHADGVLRFLLAETFAAADIPFAVVRRYEALREEPVVRACLTLAILAHTHWRRALSQFDVAEALGLALQPLDPLRSALLAQHVYDERGGTLKEGREIGGALRERISFAVVERYEALRVWLASYNQVENTPFDHFLRRLFGEVLAGPHLEPEGAAAYSKLIASASAFRLAAPAMGLSAPEVGLHYCEMVFSGVVAAQYLAESDVDMAPDSIALVAPVYTYLLSGHMARYQFWLDIGSLAWWDPLHQPLTNHYVLTRRWNRDERWTDAVDFSLRNRNLHRLVRGLALRCRDGIFLCTSEREGRGEVQDSPLLMAVQQVLQEGR
jgi:hypothetical protein